MARVDIIMPLYDKAHCVERAIRSIRAQTMMDWHLIVVDDGSTDGGGEKVHGLADERIEIIRQENQGPGAARNAGIARATAEYLAFLDADDEWYPWYLENSLKAMEEDDITLVSTMYHEWPQKIDMTGHWARRGVYCGRFTLSGIESPQWVESLLLFLHVGNTLLRTEIAKKYGGFYDAKRCVRGEDTVFFMRLGINESFKIISPAAVRHHREDSGLSHTSDFPSLPMLTEPSVVLDYCPEHKKDLMIKVLDRLALRTARNWARHGYKQRAAELIQRFPGVKRYRRPYYRCRIEIAFSLCFAYWVKFKCAIGPPIRRFFMIMFEKLYNKSRFPDTEEQQEN